MNRRQWILLAFLLLCTLALVFAGPPQQAPATAAALRDAQSLGWRVGMVPAGAAPATFLETVDTSASFGLKFVEGDYRQKAGGGIAANLDPSLNEADRKVLLNKLAAAGISMPVYFAHFPIGETGCRAVFDFAKRFGVETIVAEPEPGALDLLEKLVHEYGINLAIHNRSRELTPAYWDPAALVKLIERRSPRIGACGNLAEWMRSGIRPLDALALLKARLLTLHVADAGELGSGGRDVVWGTGVAGLEAFIKEVYKLELKPTLWSIGYAAQTAESSSMTARSLEFFNRTMQPLASYQRDYVSRTKGVRRLAEISAEERRLVESALPGRAPAIPKKPRRLLIVDVNLGRAGHPSIPYANLAVELMGKKTGVFETVISHDTSLLEPAQLRQFDALYLNNTAGDLFDTPEKKNGLVFFIREGGGLLGNHATTITSPNWPEFGEILGARGASHRMTDEKVIVKLDDPLSPINAAFGGRSFEFSDEIFRFEPPYSRQKAHVLMSIDVEKTDLNQGRCFGKCLRDDNDYAIAWIREYGKGRIFYSTFGHAPPVFWDSRILEHWLAAIQYALGDLDPSPPSVGSILGRLSKMNYAGNSAAVRELDACIAAAAGKEPELRLIEKRLLDFLESNATTAAKDTTCRRLSIIGTETAAPVLARLLDHPELSGIALYALERIPGAAIDKVLRDALPAASGEMKIALVNSLGARRDERAVPALTPLLSNSELGLAAAALAALGRIGDGSAASALAEARKKGAPALRSEILESSLSCAARLAERGDRKMAESIYGELSGGNQPALIRIGALEGMTRLAGEHAAPFLLKAIQGADARVRDAAINLISQLPGAEITAMLAGELPRQSVDGRVRLLYALGRRRDPAARKALLGQTGAAEEPLRIAALDGLGNVGTGKDILLLAERAAAGKGAEQSTARQSLYRLSSPDAGQAVPDTIAKSESKVKLELVRACGERGMNSCFPTLLVLAQNTDADLRKESIRALRNTASKAHLGQLLDLMDSSTGDERSEVGAVVASVLRRAEKEGATDLIARYTASVAAEKRVALLDVMGQVGSNEMLPIVRSALKEENPDLRRAAIAAASAWPVPDPMPDLLAAAGADPNQTLRILALRGGLRLLALPSKRATAETAALLTLSMKLAAQADEKKAILALAPRFPHAQTLELAEAAMSDSSVAGEAKVAVERIRKALETVK